MPVEKGNRVSGKVAIATAPAHRPTALATGAPRPSCWRVSTISPYAQSSAKRLTW